ncbi:MAG: TorF family putative porin [Rhizomicrobium sp.]
MKSVSLKLGVAAVALAGIAASSAAFADEDNSLGTFSASVAVASDYRFRGISQNNKEATPEFGLNWAGNHGFYGGAWTAKTNWGGNDPSYEADFFVGKHTDLDGTDLNIEAYYYSYPDANYATTASFYETIVQLSHAFGPLTLTATGANSPEWSFKGGVGWYGGATAAYTLTDWLTISGNVGHQWVDKAPNDYTHADIGLTAVWKSFSLDLRYLGTDIKKEDCTSFWMATKNACSGGFTATVTYNIAKLF